LRGDPRKPPLQGGIDFGDHGVLGFPVLNLTQESVLVEARVSTNPHFSNVRRRVAPAVPEQFDGAAVRIGVDAD
jgi:hypothetical protein